jgi:hypothetical protein
MGNVIPVEKVWTVDKNISEASVNLLAAVRYLKGDVVKSTESYIECRFGSLLKSRLIGEFWVSRATLPKKAEIYLQPTADGQTTIKLIIKDTHKYGLKAGFVGKYQQALQELADYISNPAQSPQQIFCTSCGAPNLKDSNFCTECGSKLIH